MKPIPLFTLLPLAIALAACNGVGQAPAGTTAALQEKVQTIVVIYAENRSFDNL